MTEATTLILKYGAWKKQYKPLQNHLRDDASYEGTMFEIDEKEMEFVGLMNPNYVWTLVDTEYGEAIIEGVHWVNRIGYFVCENPWTRGDIEVMIRQ